MKRIEIQIEYDNLQELSRIIKKMYKEVYIGQQKAKFLHGGKMVKFDITNDSSMIEHRRMETINGINYLVVPSQMNF